MNEERLLHYIRQITPISDEGFAKLASIAAHHTFRKAEHLLEQGHVCKDYYLVDSGYLRTYYHKDGSAINIHFTFEGGFTTVLNSLKDRMPSQFTIEAGEKATVWIFDRKALADLCTASPEVLLFSRRLVSRMLMASEESNNLFKMYTPLERYRYLEKNSPDMLQRVPLSQIASYLGVKRETLSRLRSKK